MLPVRVYGDDKFRATALGWQFVNRRICLRIWLVLPLCIFAGRLSALAVDVDFFETRIRPVLVEHCYECHSAKSGPVESDFLLDTRDGIRKGGASGRDAVIPGDVPGSQLIAAIRHENEKLRMPKEKLPDPVIADFEKWVAAGAPDPRDGISRLPREIKAESHWAFQAPKKHPLPPVNDKSWPRGRIDHFILAKLEKEGVKPAPDADRRTLIRRAAFELTGLPPTLEEIESFLRDDAPTPEAFAVVIDRLLADPGFGERWGRHWLDVARFAESSSYSRNMLYPYAWRYRDWVIDAFNRDLPYDQFVKHQIAGDLLPAKSPPERERQMIATGFLTIGPKTLNEGDPLLFELNVADDQIDATCRAFLALTVNCARCHDHKYDPIPTRDYYALAGIFRSSRNLAGVATNVRFEHEKAYPLGEEGFALVERREKAIADADEMQKLYMEKVKARNAIREPLIAGGVDWKKNPTPELKAAEAVVQEFQDKVKAAKAAIPDPPDYAMAMAEAEEMSEEAWKKLFEENRKAKKPTGPRIQNSPLYERGNHANPKERVPRGTLTLFEKHLGFEEIAKRESGRLQLANWLAAPENPATARVLVNRVWHHLFGAGLVETVDNFGLLGSEPSHPELLDDLAMRFMNEQNWSVKVLIRTMMLSRAWSMSSQAEASNYRRDPGNRWLWRFSPQRLEGEAIRDSVLFVGGSLERGRPESSQVEEISKQMAKAQQREIGRRDYYNKDVDTAVKHRAVYLPMARGAIFDALKLFDAPDPNLVSGARKVTIVPAQALFLMNSPMVSEQAEEFAEKLLEEPNESRRTELMFETLLGRQPQAEEKAALREFLAGEKDPPAGWRQAIHALFCSGEFRTVY